MRPKINRIWIRLILLLCISALGFNEVATAQQIESWDEVGRIPVKYIDTSQLEATPSNWTVAQDEQGILYVGNTGGLLIHNGVTWEILPVPGNIVRSLEHGPENRLYIGSFAELGYLGADSLGNPAYISLLDHIPDPYHDFADVWHTHSFKSAVFFQTSDYLFRWKNNTMQVWKPESRFTNIIPMDDHLLVTEPNHLFYVTKEDSIKEMRMEGATLSRHKKIISDGPQAILAITEKGLVRCDIDVESVSVCALLVTDC